MTETVGMILCGGFGKRLRPLTETVPKPLVEIKDDYTILDKQLFDFKNAGVISYFVPPSKYLASKNLTFPKLIDTSNLPL